MENKNTITTELLDFAYVRLDLLKNLKELAQAENWERISKSKDTTESPILFNYIVFTFKRLAQLYNENNDSNFIVFKNNCVLINTGLMTKNYERIYMLFKKSARETQQPYYCVGFFKESSLEVSRFEQKPKKAEYISSLSDLLFDTRLPLMINIDHILEDEENKKRLPADMQDNPALLLAFQGAVEILKKKLELNYKIAVPQYYKNRMQFLLPLCLHDNETTDIVLAVEKHGQYYTGHTCLTLDMAYSNARLISKPETNWLTR